MKHTKRHKRHENAGEKKMADMYHALAEVEHAAKSRVYAKHGFRAKAQRHAARAAYHAAFGDPSTSGWSSDGREATREGGLGLAKRRELWREKTEENSDKTKAMQQREKFPESPDSRNGTAHAASYAAWAGSHGGLSHR